MPASPALAAAPPPGITAQAVYVLNADTGEVYYEKNPAKPYRILSLTKLVTGYILVRDFGDRLYDPVTVTPADITRGSSAKLQAGDVWTLRDLLYGMLLVSGNDAARAIATYAGGAMPAWSQGSSSLQRFVAAMNATAASFGADHTKFADPDGMSPKNMSTARDVGMIGRVVFREPALIPYWRCDRRMVDIAGPHARTAELKSTVENIGEPNIVGAKTGSYLSKNLYHLAAGWRAPNGQTIVVAVLGAASHPARYNDARKIIDSLPRDFPALSQPAAVTDPPPPPFSAECR